MSTPETIPVNLESLFGPEDVDYMRDGARTLGRSLDGSLSQTILLQGRRLEYREQMVLHEQASNFVTGCLRAAEYREQASPGITAPDNLATFTGALTPYRLTESLRNNLLGSYSGLPLYGSESPALRKGVELRRLRLGLVALFATILNTESKVKATLHYRSALARANDQRPIDLRHDAGAGILKLLSDIANETDTHGCDHAATAANVVLSSLRAELPY